MQKFKKLTVILLVITLVVSVLPRYVKAASSSPWITSEQFSFMDQDEGSNSTPGQTVTGYGNVDCYPERFITRPARFSPIQTEVSHEACAVETNFGYVDPAGYIELSGTKVAGELKSHSGGSVNIVAIPDSNTLITLQGTSNGFKVRFYEGISHVSLSADKALNGKMTYRLPEDSHYLQDEDGNHLYVRPETISFSSNAQWMAVDSQYVSKLRVSLHDFSVVPYAPPHIYHNGSNPQTHIAISNDGQVAIATVRNGAVSVTDIASCDSVPTQISTYIRCQQRELFSEFDELYDGYKRAMQPRFVNGELLRFHLAYQEDGLHKSKRYKLSPTGQSLEPTDYIALGDSFTSGHGAWEYYLGTDASGNDCRLAEAAYPSRITRRLAFETGRNVACAGAKLQDVHTYVQKTDIPEPNSLGEWLPGSKKQIDFVEQANPEIVTMSIGGNDIGFGDILKKCAVGADTCYNNYESRKQLVVNVQSKFDEYRRTIGQLQETTKSSARVYIVGYPRLAKNNGNCALNVRLNAREVRFSNQIINYLNEVIQAAAKHQGAFYVDVKNAFRGHRFCETASERVAIHGATAGRDFPVEFSVLAGESFHPKRFGHRLLQRKILRKTGQLQMAMPAADASVVAPEITDSMPLLKNYVQARELENTVVVPSMIKDHVLRGGQYELGVAGDEYSIAPLSQLRVEMHSEPIELGQLQADENGNVLGDITIPDDTPPGVHTLHLYGTNIAGDIIDITKTVYVEHSEGNVDGDMFPDEIDRCPIIDVKIDGESKNKKCHRRV